MSSRHARSLLLIVSITLFSGGVMTGAQAGWMATKAVVAQQLLERAWRRSLAGEPVSKPWPWADIVPVARLSVVDGGDPGGARSLIVLQDASGEAMAFGPGLVAGDLSRAGRSTIALGGHRDSHLAFLESLPLGASLQLETRDGDTLTYQLDDTRVVDSRDGEFAIPDRTAGLVLITCYPFHATQTGGPLRYLASARYVSSSNLASNG